MKKLYYDVVIAGCGVAGLYTALHLGADKRILMLSKEDLESCDSMLAQGGIGVLPAEGVTILRIRCARDITRTAGRAWTS